MYESEPIRPIPFITDLLINQALVEMKTFHGLEMQVHSKKRFDPAGISKNQCVLHWFFS